jgi:hypothetical protein
MFWIKTIFRKAILLILIQKDKSLLFYHEYFLFLQLSPSNDGKQL